MRFFDLVNIEHFIIYLFPTLAFCVVFAVGLAFSHIRGRDSEERKEKIIESYAGGIEGRNAPFPLVLMLIIAGTVIWCLAYIIITGVLGVRI